MRGFPEFEGMVDSFITGDVSVEDEVSRKRLFCSDCEFFTPGEDEGLECSCYRILMRLIDRGYIGLEQLKEALKD